LIFPPRWLGDNVWLARGSSDRIEWGEIDSKTGKSTGRSVEGRPGCLAAQPGSENILEERLRRSSTRTRS
jgi:hypothetical protein